MDGVKSRKQFAGAMRAEGGFTLVELLVTVVILGILLTLAAMNWVGITRENALSSGAKQVEAAMTRAKTMAQQENVTYIVRFMTHGDGAHPDTYAFFRPGQADPVQNKAVVGEDNHGGYIALENGVNVGGASTISITFTPAGTMMSVTPAPVSVNLSMGGSNRTVSVSGTGDISM